MLRTASLSHVIDIPVVTQPQVPMFPKVKSTTEILQVPFMMVHHWLPLGTGGSISQLFHNTKVPTVQMFHTGGSFSETADCSMNDVPGMRQKQVSTNWENPEDL